MTVLNIVVTIFFLIGITVALIDWRGLIEKYFGNDYLKARIFIKAGNQVKPVNGVFVYDDDNGEFYKYRFEGVDYVVAVPKDLKLYPYEFIRGRRFIRVNAGNAVANGEFVKVGDFKAEPDGSPIEQAPAFMISKMVFKHGISESINSVEVKKSFSLTWLIIIGAILVVGYLAYTLFFKGSGAPSAMFFVGWC